MNVGEVWNRIAVRILLLAGILSTLAAVELSYLPGTGLFGIDGPFYVNAVRNVPTNGPNDLIGPKSTGGSSTRCG
jgi:hypothetical protein